MFFIAFPFKSCHEQEILFAVGKVLATTFKSFSEDKGMKLSASLAYYTIFSIGPLLLLLMSLASIFF